MNTIINTLNLMFAVSALFFLCLNSNATFASSSELLSDLRSIANIYSKFVDEIELVSNTPRFLVNQRIISLRKLRNELASIDTIGCSASVQSDALETMNFGIEGFERFANKSSFSEDSSFSLFRAYHARVMKGFKECNYQVQLDQEQEREELESKNTNEQKTDNICEFSKKIIEIAVSNRNKGLSSESSKKMLLSVVTFGENANAIKDANAIKEKIYEGVFVINNVVYKYNKLNEGDIYNLIAKTACNNEPYQ